VFFQFKDPAFVRTNSFKDPIAVKQSVIKYRNLRVFLVVILAVDINFHQSSRVNLGKPLHEGKAIGKCWRHLVEFLCGP
jgi:hypothetical protein